MPGRKRPRATVEDTMLNICDDVRLNGSEQEIMMRLWTRGLQSARAEAGLVPLRVWRAFYARHPDAMLQSRNALVRARSQQFKAEDAAAAAARAFDDVLALAK